MLGIKSKLNPLDWNDTDVHTTHEILIWYNENSQRPDQFSKQKGNIKDWGFLMSLKKKKKRVMENYSVAGDSCVSRLTENKRREKEKKKHKMSF